MMLLAGFPSASLYVILLRMRISGLPFVYIFESDDPGREAVLRIGEENGMTVYRFTVRTPLLIRMGDENDSHADLFLGGRWESFYASRRSTMDIVPEVEILENNNRTSRYRMTIRIPSLCPEEIKARAEGLILD